MNVLHRRQNTIGGFSLPEMSVAIGVLGLLGIVFFQVLNSGIILFAKNTAVNAAHNEARDGIQRLTRDIHAAVSVPQLRDSNYSSSMNVTNTFDVISGAPVNGVARMAAGISFQNIYSGPTNIYKDPGTPTLIQIQSDSEPIRDGMRLVIPAWGLEDDIYKHQPLQAQNAFTNVFVVTGFEATVDVPSPNSGKYAICYYTERMLYVVRNGTYTPDSAGAFVLTTGTPASTNLNRFRLTSGSYIADSTGSVTITPAAWTSASGSGQRYRYENGELWCYKQRFTGTGSSGTFYWEPQGVVSRYLSSPTPFYIPLVADSAGAFVESTNSYQGYTGWTTGNTAQRYNLTCNNKYVGVKLTARDPKSSNRGFLSTAALLNTQIDYRSRICLFQ